MPKQKSNALVVYTPGAAEEKQGKPLTTAEVLSLVAKALAPIKAQMGNPQKSLNDVGIPPYARLMADPLHAPLCARPDAGRLPSNVYRLVDVSSVSGQYGAALVSPGLKACLYASPIIDATSLVTGWGTASDSQYLTSLTADNIQYKSIAMCVEWMPTQNDMTVQGQVMFGFYPTTGGTAGMTGQLISAYFDDGSGLKFEAGKPACAIVRPNTPPFYSSLAAGLSGNFPMLLFAFNGTTATGVLGTLTVTRIVECVPIAGNIPSMTAGAGPVDPLAAAAGDNVRGISVSVNGGTEDPYTPLVKLGTKMAAAASADLADWTGAKNMSRVRAMVKSM